MSETFDAVPSVRTSRVCGYRYLWAAYAPKTRKPVYSRDDRSLREADPSDLGGRGYFIKYCNSGLGKLGYSLWSHRHHSHWRWQIVHVRALRSVVGFFWSKIITRPEYDIQANGQVERNNQTPVARLRQNIVKHQQYWDMFHQPLIFVYSTRLHRTTGAALFSLTLSREPPRSLTLSETGLAKEKYSNLPSWNVRMAVLDRLHHHIHEAKRNQAKLLTFTSSTLIKGSGTLASTTWTTWYMLTTHQHQIVVRGGRLQTKTHQ